MNMKSLLSSTVIIMIALEVYSQCNLVYTGPVNGDWHTPSNWNLCKVPDANDLVTIPNGGHVRINNTNATCRRITVQAGGSVTRNGTGTLTVTNSTGTVPCTAACTKRVFVTSTFHNGNLGGLAGADNICQTRANAASLGGTWKAWLSSSTTSANSRLVNHTVDIIRIDNVVVANGWADLTDGNLDNPISITELAGPVTNPITVWTNTTDNGNIASTNNHCNNWTSTGSITGILGQAITAGPGWSYVYSQHCIGEYHLYCFEQ